MAIFNRTNMKYSYRWIGREFEETPFSQPPRKIFNRIEGTDVLYVVDRFMSENHLSLASSGQKIERMLKEELPPKKYTLSEVLSWVRSHW